MIIRYEDLVYNKKNTILSIIKFFNKNFKIKFIDSDNKIQKILGSTDFEKLKKLRHIYQLKNKLQLVYLKLDCHLLKES